MLDTETPQVVVRAELLQLLSVAETGLPVLVDARADARRARAWWRRSRRADRARLVPALLHAVRSEERGRRLDAGAGRADPRRREARAPRRVGRASARRARRTIGPTRARALASALVETARRVGLVAAADLRFVARVLTRLDETLPKMQTVGKLDDLDEFIGGAAPVRTLLGFAATDVFGKALEG